MSHLSRSRIFKGFWMQRHKVASVAGLKDKAGILVASKMFTSIRCILLKYMLNCLSVNPNTFICSARLQLLAASISCYTPSDWTTIDIPQTVRKNNCTHYFIFPWEFSVETNAVLLSLRLLHPRIYHPEMCFDVVITFHFSASFSPDSGSKSCGEGNRLHTMTHLISFYTDISDSSERHTATLKKYCTDCKERCYFYRDCCPVEKLV